MTTTRKETERAVWFDQLEECCYVFGDGFTEPEWSVSATRTLPTLQEQIAKLPANGKQHRIALVHSRGHANSCCWGIRSGQYGPGLYAWTVKAQNKFYEDSWFLVAARKPA